MQQAISTSSGDSDTGGANWRLAEIALPVHVRPVVAVGAESKGAFCIAAGGRAWMSVDFGPLSVPANFRRFCAAVEDARRDTGVTPQIVACDMHPSYVSTGYAGDLGMRVCRVQHHHAHVASCLTEHGMHEPVVGICGDGAGYGPDKASWGCEVLHVEPDRFRRLAHLRYFGLPGSDKAATECWRPALSFALQAYGGQLPPYVRDCFAGVPADQRTFAERMIERSVQCPQTSSLGRLFDVTAFLLAVCLQNESEGQAAIALQKAAERSNGSPLAVEVAEVDGVQRIDFAPAMRDMLERKAKGVDVCRLAADFHETVAVVLARVAAEHARGGGLTQVALSGGCFANGFLTARVKALLERDGITVLAHERVSTGDAGLALGQAMVAGAQVE